MYDQEMLSIMADEAKAKLYKQQKDEEEKNEKSSDEEPVDLYARFRNNDAKLVKTPDRKTVPAEQDFSEYKKLDEITNDFESPMSLSNIELNEDEPVDLNTIYPNGPSPSDIEIWKKQYPDCLVMLIEVSGEYFVIRTITRPEYKKLVSLYKLNALQREEIMCATCILYPKNLDYETINKLRGGVPSTIASIIMEHSGFTKEYGVQVL